MIRLLREYDMPVFMVDEAGYFIRVLLDTGANLSVFNGTENGLFQYYTMATKTEYLLASRFLIKKLVQQPFQSVDLLDPVVGSQRNEIHGN